MDNPDALASDMGNAADSPSASAGSPVPGLGAQTLDAVRGVNRHHELRMANRYAQLAQAAETQVDGAADASSMDASGVPA